MTSTNEFEALAEPNRNDSEPSESVQVSPQLPIITENEVMMATAAAVHTDSGFELNPRELESPATKRNSGLLAYLSRLFDGSRERRPRSRYVPSRYDFTSDARMAREMERL